MFSAKLILSPIDFSDFSLQALEVAEDIAKPATAPNSCWSTSSR